MKLDNIYFDFTIATGMFNFTLFCFPKWVLLDIRFTRPITQIVLFNQELYFKYKGGRNEFK